MIKPGTSMMVSPTSYPEEDTAKSQDEDLGNTKILRVCDLYSHTESLSYTVMLLWYSFMFCCSGFEISNFFKQGLSILNLAKNMARMFWG